MPNLTDPNFKLPPIRPEKENVAADISVVKCETSLRVPKDNVRLNPELDYIVEQKRKKELVERLDRKRSTAELTRDKLEIQWRHLAQNELTFQRTIIGHNRFLKRNLEKRERALAKIQTDIDLTKKREKEIKALDQKYDFFNGVLSKMRYEIKRHNIYEDYMNYVVELQDSPFKAPFEFLTKYETLQSVKEHCVKRQTEEMAVTVLVHDNNVEFFRLQDVILIVLMRPLYDSKWKLPSIPLKKLNPKLQQTLSTLPSIHLPKDAARNDSSLNFLHDKNRLEKLDVHLARKRALCMETARKLEKKWKNLVMCENRLRTLVISQNAFVKNNLEKRIRATTRMQQNERLAETRQRNIEELKNEMDVARFLMAEFKKQIGKHCIYDDFLTKLTEFDESPYKTINDLLRRFEMMEDVKERRRKEQKAESSMILTVHQDMKDMVHCNNVSLIGLRNDLNNLRCQFDEVCRKNLSTETLITSIVNRTNELNVEVTSCQYMIDAIYRYVCQRRKIPHADYALRDVKPKIDTIKSTLGVWEQILTSSELSKKRKKSLKMGRKSYGGKASLAQAVFMWKRKSKVNSGLET